MRFDPNFDHNILFWPRVVHSYNLPTFFPPPYFQHVTTQVFFPLFTLLQQLHFYPKSLILFLYLSSSFLSTLLLQDHFYSADYWIEGSGSVIIFSSFILFLKFYALSTPNHYTKVFEDDFAWSKFLSKWIIEHVAIIGEHAYA